MAGRPPIGSVVAGYRLISLVGTGATGAVYLAEREGSGERVALKLLDPELARDERFRQRMLRESRIAASLDHPHAVPIVDFGEADGVLYLAMRFVDGSDLRELLAAEGPLDPERALDLLGQVAGALDEAHARGLVHRDVKPANILVEGEQAYLGDFGLAKHVSSASNVTGDHSFVGTIAYVSPEQIKGEEIDGRSDVYSLGCVLYECLAGEPPFDRESELAVVYAHLNERTPRLTETRPELPAGLDDVIRVATAKEPADRFESCTEMVHAARRALAGERLARRRRVGGIVAILAGLAVIAGVIVAVAGGGGGGSGPPPRPPVPRLAVGGPGIALVNASNRRVEGRVPLAERPGDLVFSGGSAWALLGSMQRLAEIDVARRRQVGSVALPFVPGGVAAAGDSLFVTEEGGPGLVRIDAGTRKIADRWTVDTHGARHVQPDRHRDRRGIGLGGERGRGGARERRPTGRVQHRFALPVTATLVDLRRRRRLGSEQRERRGGEDRPRGQPDRRTRHAARLDQRADGGERLGVGRRDARRRAVPPQRGRRERGADRAGRSRPGEPRRRPRQALAGQLARPRADGHRHAVRGAHVAPAQWIPGARPRARRPAVDGGRAGAARARPRPRRARWCGSPCGEDSIDADPATGVPPWLNQLLYSTCVEAGELP